MQRAAHCALDHTSAEASSTISLPLRKSTLTDIIPSTGAIGQIREVRMGPTIPLVVGGGRRHSQHVHRRAFRSRSEFAMTDTELNVIAALASIGLRTSPKKGYKIPAASGTPIKL